MNKVKLKLNSLYTLPSGDVCKLLRLDREEDSVILYNFSTKKNEILLDLEVVKKLLTPLYTINEVSKIIGRKSDTIRKQEYAGNISKARQVSLGRLNAVRVYTQREVEDLDEFFYSRQPRTSADSAMMHSPLHRKALQMRLNQKYER